MFAMLPPGARLVKHRDPFAGSLRYHFGLVTPNSLDWFNSLFSAVILRATATKNMEGDRVGFLNRIFAKVYVIRALGKKLKAWNKLAYYLAQYALYALLIWLIFF